MICDKCKSNPATFFSSVNINGNITETHLCANCAGKYNDFSLNNFFNGPNLEYDHMHDVNYDELACSKCGYLLSDYFNSGFLGCSNCYSEFREHILNSLAKMQPDIKHVGKNLELFNSNEQLGEIKNLEIQLKQAVNEENYELASLIKKKIIAIKERDNENR